MSSVENRGAPIQVRQVRPEDFDEWKVLWDGYNEFYGRSGATALPEDITTATWARFFDAYEPVHGIVAELDGKLVGIANFLFHRNTTQLQPNCYLQDLFTSANVRGRGVGRKLIESVYEEAKARRVPRVYWQTHETNTTAQRLYDGIADKSGFIVYRKNIE